MAKRIKISDNLAIEFNQRARGEETPYWVGTIWDVSGRKAEAVGDFSNGGTGGPTNVRIFKGDRDALVDMAKAAFADLGVDALEPDDAAIAYAELIGYGLKCGFDEFSLQDHVDLVWGDDSVLGSHSARSDAQKARAAAAEAKANRIQQTQAAKKAAKAGKTIVKVGDDYYTFKTRDAEAIRRTAGRQFAGQEIEILA